MIEWSPYWLLCSCDSAAGAMPGAGVAVQAIEPSARRPRRVEDLVDEGFVTSHTVHPNHVSITRRDLDRLLEVLKGKRERVPEPMLRLGRPLGDARVRQVALDTGRGVAVPTLEPPVVLRVHDVAVHAGSRVWREIGEAFRVDEGEGTDSRGDSQQAGEEDSELHCPHSTPFSHSSR